MTTEATRGRALTLDEKRALVAQLLQQRNVRPPVLPLSFAQERLWFLDRLAPGSALHNIPTAVRLRGALDTAALAGALNAIVARHEALRTTFSAVAGQPAQRIAPGVPLPLPVSDLGALPPAEREAALARLVAGEARVPFDLATGPLLRARLLRLGVGDHALVLTLSHLAADGWSLGVLHGELSRAYSALVAGATPDLPPLPIQYADFAIWQRRELGGAALDRQLDYWREQLRGANTILDLPADRPRPPALSYAGALHGFTVPADLTAAVRALGQREGCTLYMTLLTAFAVLLQRHTGQEDLLIGSPVAGRTRPETEGLIGCFINTLALRVTLDGDPSFPTLLRRVRETALAALAHQELPFERLVEALQPGRDRSRPPLLQVLFALQNMPARALDLPGLTAEEIVAGNGTAKLDFSLYLTEDAGALRGLIEYSTDLFDESTVARLAGHYATLLAGAVAEPDRPISALPLLSAAERQLLLVERNATVAPLPRSTVHDRIAAQAARTPDAVAVEGCGDRLTYAALDARANQVAHHLRGLGVAPGTLVGVCLERSPAMLVALLGILKAGGAYVPLDPAYPAERLAHMLADSRAPILVTTTGLLPDAAAAGQSIVRLDAERGAIAAMPATDPGVAATPDDRAYVLYTSGSTGRPKGVQIPHRALTNFLAAMAREPGLTADDTLVAVTTLSFDIAALELFLPLTVGARVVLADRATATDGGRLAALLAASGATVLQATPATWRMLLAAGWGRTPGLTAFCGGEALPRDLAEAILARAGALWNLYGPTETTIWSTAGRVTPGDGPPSLGRPIANTRLYVLDPAGRPLPLGVPGELHIGGAGVADGYLGRPALTAERFLPDPFAGEAGARMYRTGDRVRWRADGGLEYHGRMDQQIKLRGFRIEPGEIEATLAAHPAVRQAVVALREDAPGDPRLVAYLVPERAADVAPDALRAHLRARLPEHMVPASFVSLDALPLTPNGKVDRRALPAPGETIAPVAGTERRAARDDLERQLIAIWEATLGVAPIGPGDNFFDLGGHSLVAVRLFARIEAGFGRKLPLATLFAAPTVADLAAIVREQGWVASWSSLVALEARGERPPFYCIHAIGGNVLKFGALARALGPDQPFYGLQARGLDGRQPLLTSVEAMAATYLTEIRRLQPHGPYYLGGQCFGGMVALEMTRQLEAAGERVGLLAMFDDYAPGYTKLLSPVARLRLGLRWLGGRSAHHLASLRRQGRAAVPGYLAARAGTIRRRLRSRADAAQLRRHEAGGAALPAELRNVRVANGLAQRAYVPRPICARPVLFMTDDSGEHLPDPDPLWGWGQLATTITVRDVPGDHDSMWEDPHATALAAELRAALDAARAREAARG